MRFSIVARISRLNDSELVNTVSTKVGTTLLVVLCIAQQQSTPMAASTCLLCPLPFWLGTTAQHWHGIV